MAERRMFSKTLMESDSFIELSDKAKLLYIYLGLTADDDGFIGSIKKTMMFVEADKNNLQELIEKEYLIRFESGVCVIKHWKVHNYLRNDRYHPTLFQEEFSKLVYDEISRTYSLVDTTGIPTGRQTGNRDKTSIDKIRLEKTILPQNNQNQPNKNKNNLNDNVNGNVNDNVNEKDNVNSIPFSLTLKNEEELDRIFA